jgi:hypothetical protein
MKFLKKRSLDDYRFILLRIFVRIIFPKYPLHWHQLYWLNNKQFQNFLIKFKEKNECNAHRRWMMSELIRLVENIPGHTVECGCFEGAGSYIIAKFNSNNPSLKKDHYIFDSFQGLSNPTSNDGNYWIKGDLSVSELTLKNNLIVFSENLKILKGWIPDRFDEVKFENFSFVHIDVDLEIPTIQCLEFFYPLVSEGGIILFDDYGFETCPGATKKIDYFFENKNEKVIRLPNGSGFIIKGKFVGKSIF